MTVSRVITNHPYVSQNTAERVRAAILQLNYQPNRAARVLNGQLTRSIALIVPDVADRFFSAISHAVQETARANGYVVLLAASNNDPENEAALIEQMTYHPVDGILLVPADSKRKHLTVTASSGIPLVAIDRRIEVAKADSVEVNNRRGARAGVEHLVHHGCKRIVCVAQNSQLPTIRERIAGYQECLRRAKLPPAKTLHVTDEAEAKDVLITLLLSRRRPDALFTTNNSATICTIDILDRTDMKIGRDVALVGFDDVEFYTLLHPSITAIRQPTAELGETSARLLLQRIHGDPLPPQVHSILPVDLIIRESCGCERRDPLPNHT
nr:LacI family DNA-binding transcriptional regulator [Acidisarcina polymorpha]